MITISLPVCGQIQALKPMDPAAHPSFEVATIKHSDPDDQHGGFHLYGRNVFIEKQTMDDLISFAYGVHVKQIVDAPTWFGSQPFDIKGFADATGQPNVTQYREMVQKLLADRFQLKFHRDRREMSCFVLTVAKGGAKIEATKSAPDALQDQTSYNNGNQQTWRFTNNPMAEFASFLQSAVLDRPVVDETGLKGKYDFKLTWTPGNPPVAEENAPPGFFTAIKEQDGLKVEPGKDQVPVLVIDHVQQPAED